MKLERLGDRSVSRRWGVITPLLMRKSVRQLPLMRTAASVMALVVSATGCSGQQGRPLVLTACPETTPACVTMSLDIPSLPVAGQFRSPPNENAAGYSNFDLTVRGRLQTQFQDSIPITIRGYTAGLSCSVFGQAVAAVVGFTPQRNPIVLTTMGRLVVDDSSLVVGCPRCGRLLSRDGRDTVAFFTTPGWDLPVAGHRHLQFGYGDDGSLFIATERGCVALPPVGDFQVVAESRCEPAKQIGSGAQQVPGFSLGVAEWLLEQPSAEHVLFIRAGAC